MIPLNCAIVFGCIYKVVELFVHKRERLMLISKITELSNVDFKGINFYSSGNKFTALRVGWLLMGVGLGFFVGFFLNLMTASGRLDTLTDWEFRDHIGGIIYVSCVSFFGGIGLLISYYTERRAEDSEDKKKDESQF